MPRAGPNTRGWDTYGIEINAEAARYCREVQRGEKRCRLPRRAHDTHTYPENSFDAMVFAGRVMKHCTDPLDLMKGHYNEF